MKRKENKLLAPRAVFENIKKDLQNMYNSKRKYNEV